MSHTLEYYNTHASAFQNDTVSADMHATHEIFLKILKSHYPFQKPEKLRILDFGCGAGRDTKVFLSEGYCVSASDGSEELVKIASEFTGIEVRHLLFNNLEEENAYEGVWACASILHLNREDLKDVMKRIARSLKENGILYTSFKYGTFEGERNGRYFTDFTEDSFEAFLEDLPFSIERQWISQDVRPGRENERWLNVILHKQERSK